MKKVTEQVLFDGNEIIELGHAYNKGSVKIFVKKNTESIPLEVNEIGGNYVSFDTSQLTLNDILDINYIIEEETTKFNSLERIQVLEQKVLELEKAQKQIFESLYHRVSNETFNTWLKALEKQLGVEIISQQFSAPYPK